MVGGAGSIDQEVLDDLNSAIVDLIDNLRRNYYKTKCK